MKRMKCIPKKSKKIEENKPTNVRRIEDIPFYNFKYKVGDLPLDPARKFIQENITKMNILRNPEFTHDLDLHYWVYKVKDEFDQFFLAGDTLAPISMYSTRYPIVHPTGSAVFWSDLCDEEPPTVEERQQVTLILMDMYIKLRTKIYQDNAEILWNLSERHRVAISKHSTSCRVFPYKGVPKKKEVFKYQPGDELLSWKPGGLRKELDEMGKVVESLIRPQISMFEAEKKAIKSRIIEPARVFCKNQQLPYIDVKRRTSSTKSCSPKSLIAQIRKKESIAMKELQVMQPVDPETQQMNQLAEYNKIRDYRNSIFYGRTKSKILNIMEALVVEMFQTYPSHLIQKTFSKIDKRSKFLNNAAKFVADEKKLWPNIAPEVMLLDFLFTSKNQVPENRATMVIALLLDLQEDFKYHMKLQFLRYIFQSATLRNRLQITSQIPPAFPVILIRAPIWWKSSIHTARNKMEQKYMVDHPVLRALTSLWNIYYSSLLIFNAEDLFIRNVPMHADLLTDTINNACSVAKDVLLNDWMPKVADVCDYMMDTWKGLVANTIDGGRAAILFRSIHSLMSYQVRGMIKRSVDHLLEYIRKYANGNDMNVYDRESPMFYNTPVMSLRTAIVGKFYNVIQNNWDDENPDMTLYQHYDYDPDVLPSNLFYDAVETFAETRLVMKNTGKFTFSPTIADLPDLFVSYFVKIINVGYNIPRLEFYMSNDPSVHGFLHVIQENHVDMLKIYDEVRMIVSANQKGPVTFLFPIYKYYYPLFNDMLMQLLENVFLVYQLPSLPEFINLINMLTVVINGIYDMPDFVRLNMFTVDMRNINKSLIVLVKDLKEYISNYFKALNIKINKRICDDFEEMSMHAGERPKETPEVVALQNYLAECRDEKIYKLKDEIKIVAERVGFLLYYGIVSPDEMYLNSRTFLWPKELEQVLDLSSARLMVVRDGLEIALKERRVQFEEVLQLEKKRIEIFRLREIKEMLSLEELKEKCDMSDNLVSTIEKCSREAKAIIVDEVLLQMEPSQFLVLEDMIRMLEPIERLWKTAYTFDVCYDIWYYGNFVGLDSEKIREQVDSMSKVIQKLLKTFSKPLNAQAKRVAEQVRMKLDKFKTYLPVLDGICQKGLVGRHWDQISEELGAPVNPETHPTLAAMIEADIQTVVQKLEDVSNAASKEFDLNLDLLSMQDEWKDIVFELHPYRGLDTFMLAAVDDIQTLLDDHVLKVQAMRGSPFISALGARATDWEDKLISIQDILDIWLQVQATWIYLEPIFSSEDIMRQMPTEGRNFKNVDRKWRRIMEYVNEDRHVLKATEYPDMLKILKQSFIDLEVVQKGLNTYLEKKRLYFARFFFLSNDELLEILSETKDARRVQPHLKKCFEGIYSLVFDQNEEVTAMVSGEDEEVKLVKKICPNAANGLVEKWLKEVEISMIESMTNQNRMATDAYKKVDRKSWVLQWPGQVIQTISCLTWTYEVEEAIEKHQLPEYLEKCNSQIAVTVELVKGKLSPSATLTIEALIVLDVHGRDLVKYLADTKVMKTNEFNWLSQLRYYWQTDEETKIHYIGVSMVATEVKYGQEYLGNVARLVVTPLTDRCYRTLMGAFKVNLGGAPEGPAGTGKTETCKDLAKAVAKKCVVFNCSDGLDYKSLGKFFKGLAQSGAWACFDEFNRIELEVLSVVAQQILTIQRAIARKVTKFFFEDTMLKLDPTCAIFITMNPGYAGRTELPDNLKVLFRTVAMMVPDYALIGEITLYSNGFNEARSLAQKIVHTYKLCSEQLSSQHHYDYGMRAVKSVLLASGALRRQHPELQEAQIVLRAIIDVNAPKFLQEDIPLFESIYTDLFPGVEVPTAAREDIVRWLRIVLERRNLQATSWYVEKIMQIYEMMMVRHGLMIVGGPMGGKTTAYECLAEALKEVSKDRDALVVEYKVSTKIINPKAITIGQLYGNFDPTTHEWTDGVLAKSFKEMVYSYIIERSWLIFDGPVDAVWIENLNTVLDDNKKLCLMSGEIIQMTKTMMMMFEPADLDQASPATISRCGMIYMAPEQLGWIALHQSFLNDLKVQLNNDIYMGLYESLVDWLIPAVIIILENCESVLQISPIQNYQLFAKFFMNFLLETPKYNQTWFQQTFLYCMAWAYGSALNNEGRKILDASLRYILYGSSDDYPKPKHFSLNRSQMYPEKSNMMDYRFDLVENWWPWLKNEEVSYPSDAQLSEVMVPTKETSTMLYWLEMCTTKKWPILISGPTGTCKTATVLSYMRSLPKEKFLLNNINMSAKTTAQQIQELIMTKLDRRRKGVFGPPVGKSCLIYIDDIAMPSRDVYGSQPALELIRTWLDHGFWSDLDNSSRLELIDLTFVGAMGLLGGSNFIFPRLYRHMFVIGIDSFEDVTLCRIFQVIGEWHFSRGYPDKVQMLNKGLAAALIQIYRDAIRIFLPTPAKSHYLFSLRDVSRVFQGIVLLPAKRLESPEKLARLWAHETYRVFYDRLIDDTDRTALLQMVVETCRNQLRLPLSQAMGSRMQGSDTVTQNIMRDLMFGDYMEPDMDPKIYDEVEDLDKLEKIITYYLNEYNEFSNAPMDLVLFRFAIEHISRVSRVFKMPNGNILMIGMGGSGRRSAVKLAASMAEAAVVTVEITRSYTFQDWREDMKRLLLQAGLSAKRTIFLFCDAQATDESFIEDINSLLNAGDLPNLFQSEEKQVILEEMQTAAKQLGKRIDTTPLALYTFFIDRVRESLHVALAFSPIGDSFKTRLRIYPSLINCCTIDWFTTWPEDALYRVAERFISSMDIEKINTATAVKSDVSVVSGEAAEEETAPDRPMTELETNLVKAVTYFNITVVDANRRFELELGRKNYVTPTLYLELLRSFKALYNKKYNDIIMQRDRYTTGLEKLDHAAGQVAVMQKNLIDLQPKLKVLSEEADKIMVVIERETAEAEKKKEVVGADEAAANEAAAAAQAIKDDCESDLAEAIPALNAALQALNTLKPADITVVKSMKNPPAAIKLVLEAVCVIRGIKPERKPNAEGKMVEDYWGASLKILGDMKFLEHLKTFDKDNIPVPVMKKVRETYISDRDFIPEKIQKVSTACEGLCRWVRAMDVYDRVAKIVAPKKLALASAESELTEQMEKLNGKRAELQVILDKLQKLNDFFAEKSKEKKNLEDDIDNCEKKLTRAETLLGGLGGEKDRWQENAFVLNNSLTNVVGDVLLSAGVIAYLGYFTTEFREKLITSWNERCLNLKIPCSEKFSVVSTLGHAMTIRQWSLCGLPSDNFSVENGIIVEYSRKYPLMIDPQGQANIWIKNLEVENKLKVLKFTDLNFGREIENALRFGIPILIENVGETLDSAIYSILEKNVVKQKGSLVIKFGDGLVEYNPNFRAYMTTCLRNPHYLPETAVMVTVLNFMITELGLTQQLLATVVVEERPDLQEKKEKLIVESARNKDTLYTLETKILQVLSSSEGNILEDENAINILSNSKILSADIQEKQIVAVATELEIDSAREQYEPVAAYSAVIFFCISEMANVEPMYQYSLGWFLNLFVMTIAKAPQSTDLQERLASLNVYFTKSVYENVCRSLFEKDKVVFSFVMCLGILMSQKKIHPSHLIFLLTGSLALHNPHPNPGPDWLSDKAWADIVGASDLKGLEGFHQSFAKHVKKWRDFYDLPNVERAKYPAPYENASQLVNLVIMKCVRPDKLCGAVRAFIIHNMGEYYVEPPSFNLEASFGDSSPTTPLIFLLSQGSDPMASLLAFAKNNGMYDRCKTISLGQGQGERAARMIEESTMIGNWVVLQNCHVAESWMGDLETICSDLATNPNVVIHEDYRLWCTSYPSKKFPVSVLQNSVKMTNEPSKGLKMNMMRSFNTDPLASDKYYSNAFPGDIGVKWLRGVFALVFFHAVIQERKEFGPLGWNIPYEFNESDLKITIMQLKMFLNEYRDIPFEGHSYLAGECNYGGRVTDDKDRRLLISLLGLVYNEKSVQKEHFVLSSSGTYLIPTLPTKANSLEYISTLPLVPEPEVFGLHENAAISRDNNETNLLLQGTLLTQSDLLANTKTDAGGGSTDDIVMNLCSSIMERLPEPFNIDVIVEKYPIMYTNSMNTVLKQECLRFNNLIVYIKASLRNVGRAIVGQIAMIPELESVFSSMAIGRLPVQWANNSYPSLKPLGSYVTNLLQRIEFLQKWYDDGEPNVYWISAFYFTQSFITGVVQNYSRKNKLQIDLVSVRFEVTHFESEADHKAEIGVYIKGLYLEAARWNRNTMLLDESFQKILFDLMPVISMMPRDTSKPTEDIPKNKYMSPIYKTSARRGILSTTGHSTNFIMFIELDSDKPAHHWINRGTACLTQLDD